MYTLYILYSQEKHTAKTMTETESCIIMKQYYQHKLEEFPKQITDQCG